MSDFGPAMTKLKPKQQLFVMTLWHKAPIPAAEAARIAGYSSNGPTSWVTACRLLQREDIKDAIIEYGKRLMAGDGPRAHAKLWELALTDGHKDQAKVLLALLGRSGHPEMVERNTNITITLSSKEKIERLRHLMLEEGKSEEEIQAQIGSVTNLEIEGEYTVVDNEDEGY